MAKRFLEDMKKTRNKAETPKRRVERPAPVVSVYDAPKVYTPSVEGPATVSRSRLWVVAVVCVLFLIFSFSVLFSGATVALSPRVESISVNQNFAAVQDGGSAESLPFDMVAISGEETRNVEGGEEKDAMLRAEGLVVLYNAFNSAPQSLSIDTRLEGSNGKIYKTKEKVTIPGMTGSTPGSVEVRIYGAEAGEGYNSGPLDFKVFGFKGTPKYEKFYARSKGDIKGGFIGKIRQISDEQKSQLSSDLRRILEVKLLAKATSQIPSGFILYKDAAFVEITDENFNQNPVSVKATLHGILFEEKALTQKIVEKSFPNDRESEIYLPNIRDLKFTMTPPESLFGFGQIQNISFNLSGENTAIWRIDEKKLLGDILGKKKRDFNQILAQYPNVLSANLSLRPFWTRTLPDEAEDIKVIVNYPQ